MKNFTLRLNIHSYKYLKNQSEYFGITLAGLLKYKLFELKGNELTNIDFENLDTVRMTLVIPNDFYNSVESYAIKNSMSINKYINLLFLNYLNN